MRAFLTKIEDFFASLFSRADKKEESDTPKKAPGKWDVFSRADALLARYQASYLAWAFLLSTAVMLLVYVAMDVFPFGQSSVLVLDLNGQYVQFFAGLRSLLHGDGSLLYSFSRSLGGEFLGIYAYYLASPLSWLVALFPEKAILEALLVMFVLKSGLAGLNFGIFLHYTRRPPKMITIGLSVLYALSSYSVVMQHNTMWMDALYLLPLLLLGLERLIRHKKPILYTVSLGLTLLSNYYIGYMMCIFTALYFFYLFLAHEPAELNPRREPRFFLSSLLRVGVYTLLGIGLAACLILPAYYSLTFGKTDFTQGSFAFVTKFDILDFITKMFPGAYDTVRPEGLPWVYSGTLSLLLLPLYFLAKKIPAREKIATGSLLFVIFLSMYINTLDVLWHGGQAPNWLNFRYSFVFVFLVLLIAARALTALKSVDYRSILAVMGALLLLVVILQRLHLTYTANGETREYFDDLNGVWLSLGALAVYGILLLFLNGHDRTSPRYEPIATLLVTVLCVETLLNGVFYLRRQNEDVTISSYASYHDFYDVYSAPFSYVKETDTSLFYRMDKTFQHTVCDSFVLGYRGLASSTSTLNAGVVRFQHALGMKANSHWTEATGSTIATNAFLGVKYWIAKEGETVDPRYTEYHRDSEAGTVTYLNPYALPLAFATRSGLADITYAMPADPVFGADNSVLSYGGYVYDNGWHLSEEWEDALWSPFTRLNATYATMTGEKDLEIYRPITAGVTTVGSMRENTGIWNHTQYSSAKEDAASRLRFTLTVPESNSPLFCYFPTKYPRSATLYVNGVKSPEAIYPDNANIASVISLGSFTEGETVTVELSFEKFGEFFLVENIPYFYTIDTAALAHATSLLSEKGLVLTKAEENYFEGSLTTTEGFTSVQTTIPYDAGWRITVDGETVEGYRTADTLLAFDLPGAGEHTIVLRYAPGIYTAGSILSALSFLLVALLLIIILLERHKKIAISQKCAPLAFFLPSPEEAEEAPMKEPMSQKACAKGPTSHVKAKRGGKKK